MKSIDNLIKILETQTTTIKAKSDKGNLTTEEIQKCAIIADMAVKIYEKYKNKPKKAGGRTKKGAGAYISDEQLEKYAK